MSGNVALIDTDDVEEVVIDKLSKGWAVLYGHNAAFHAIENQLYRPGTPANRNFELLGCIYPVAFCKKTPSFTKMFKETGDKSITVICALGSSSAPDGIYFEIMEVQRGTDTRKQYSEVAAAVKNYLTLGKFTITPR